VAAGLAGRRLPTGGSRTSGGPGSGSQRWPSGALLREGPGGDQLKAWPEGMRVFARCERPHPGAQLPLFETADGDIISAWQRVHALKNPA
jgi:hypothetical protein